MDGAIALTEKDGQKNSLNMQGCHEEYQNLVGILKAPLLQPCPVGTNRLSEFMDLEHLFKTFELLSSTLDKSLGDKPN